MPPRDDQDYEAKRQQIIDGALHVFSTKGFEAATNKDIAQAAKIGSPGLIYHYFKDKSDLFRQVLQERAEVFQFLAHTEEVMSKPPREVLTLFGTLLMKSLDNRAALSMFRLLLGEATRRPGFAEMVGKIGPARGIAFLTEYLARQMDAGVLRRMEPGSAARCFIGPLVFHLITREIFHLPDAKGISTESMVGTAVDVFLNGMELR